VVYRKKVTIRTKFSHFTKAGEKKLELLLHSNLMMNHTYVFKVLARMISITGQNKESLNDVFSRYTKAS
jgi:hypothetical protein